MLFQNSTPALGSGASVNGNLIPTVSLKNITISATDVSRSLFICPAGDAYQLVGIDVVFGTASTSGTLQLEKLTGTTAPGSGTAMLTGTVALSGSANTVASGTVLSGDAAALKLGGGDRLGLKLAGTLTNLAGCVATIRLKRILA
jgi:hypothetical protein